MNLEEVARAVGEPAEFAYEAAHVYPMSAPDFTPASGVERPRPEPGSLKLYAHVPFCNYACGFCFYAKRIGSSRDEMARYVRAILQELEWVPAGTPLEQLYVGGGTPTALPSDQLGALLRGITGRMPPTSDTSMTVEASPESITADHVATLLDCGIDRVSMGIESLEAPVLSAITRDHDDHDALHAVERILTAGLQLNVDLIYGLPGQTHEGFRRDVARVTDAGVHSVSVYNLRTNERTPVRRQIAGDERLNLERLVAWRRVVRQSLVEAGFVQRRWHTWVRPSAGSTRFTRAPLGDGFAPGRQLGIGVSAVSHLGSGMFRNDASFRSWLTRVEANQSPVAQIFELDDDDRLALEIARTLGDSKPLLRSDWESLVGRAIDVDFGDVMQRLTAAGLLGDDGTRLALTPDGGLVYDLVTLAFYPKGARTWLQTHQPVPKVV